MITLRKNETIRDALECLPEGETLFLPNGVYTEKIVITKSGVTIEGQSKDGVIITYDDYAKKIHADSAEYNTFRTYTMLIAASGVTLKNLTVQNSAGDPQTKGQAVALSINGDNVRVTNCRVDSLQDTLFCGPLPDDLIVRYQGFLSEAERFFEGTARQYFFDCEISGSVDFIFGCAEAYFLRCDIVSKNDGREKGFVAAPAHSLKQGEGFVFYDCNFVSRGAPEKNVFLARPWRDFGKAIFLSCRLDFHINPSLFDKWNDTERDKTARFYKYLLSGADDKKPASFGRELTPSDAEKILHRLSLLFDIGGK